MRPADPIEYFNSFPLFGQEEGFKPGLERVELLLRELDYNYRSVNYIHVAGSNGKGSTIAMLESIYLSSGYSVGRFISPHIEDFEERIRFDGENISSSELSLLAEKIDEVVSCERFWKDIGRPTFFEVLTAAALLHFSYKQPDIAILETGLGGRLDATNVIKSPLACVITNIDYEHTEHLGETLQEIAAEKAGIIKPGAVVITGESKKGALDTITEKSSKEGAPLFLSEDYFEISNWQENLNHQKFDLIRGGDSYSFELELMGKYQLKNASVACTTVKALDFVFPVTADEMEEGLREVSWPGRLEVLRSDPPLIVDGSHTPAGIRFLKGFINRNFSSLEQATIILSVLQDKRIMEMLEVIRNIDINLKIVMTSSSSQRALQAEDFIEKPYDKLTVSEHESLIETIEEHLKQQGNHELVCITGSLYSVLEIKNAFRKNLIQIDEGAQ
ncbi:bifunctional folylpolyglutamate synthase/dihydrofolate synthase [Halarsenatibacter silvermanii]|uniref:tetrahydrofolate synthase n=1 Tax=Halarsenatibacter silvermanii TaxID=321763 RepID=A0A1G9PB19_9FIRM|nr:folylpolyglutamate synthase/dihydrofolate synthase family protein [Halarsenatibacter silvermanii]SDL95417.1 dihydrofolate synthase / folylpolyglutamate synthase [Halarsenatibacter silvermanii]